MYKLFILFIISFFTLTLEANINLTDIDSNSYTLWIAIFGLATVSLLFIYLSSEKMRLFKKQAIQQKKDEKILVHMSEDIKNIAKGPLSDSKNINNDLIAMTTDLIEFLYIKSEKIKVVNERLQFTNLLNDVSGTLKERIKETELQLEYLIDDDIPENIYGDTLNISRILVHLLSYSVQKKASKITLNIKKDKMFSKKESLLFILSTNIVDDVENGNNIFSSNYNETTKKYDTLALHIAKKLIQSLGGNLIARNDSNGYLEFLCELQYRDYLSDLTTPTPTSTKKILFIARKQDDIKNTKDILANLKHQTVFISSNKITTKNDLNDYDLIFLKEELFNKQILDLIPKNTPIIALSNIFGKDLVDKNQDRASQKIIQPLTKESIKLLLQEIFLDDLERIDKTLKSYNEVRVYRSKFDIKPTKVLSDFFIFRDINLLIVEDNLINQKVLQGLLGKSGMNITIAEHGQEALSILNSDKKIDIVLMDINMPIMDGYTATKNIRKNKTFINLPIIALSSLTSCSEIDEMYKSGMNAYLAKPLNKEQLFNAFSMFLAKQKDNRTKSIIKKKKVIHPESLNTEQGLLNASSNDIFYKEILLEFMEIYADSNELFNKLTDEFRYEQLKLLCLDMRGLSAAIGAKEIYILVNEIIPLLVYKKYDSIHEYKDKYEDSIKKLNHAIEKYLE